MTVLHISAPCDWKSLLNVHLRGRDRRMLYWIFNTTWASFQSCSSA